jgi:peptidoglycan L-alanyl-D-glutamate endopeptidase CwlK
MIFKLSKRSLTNLAGVKPTLASVVSRAIELTTVDFVVIEGLRTAARQQELVSSGASQTMNSKHLTGDAVDLAAWLGTIRWEMPLYFKIADAVRQAAKEQNVGIRWGGAWNVSDLRIWNDSMEQAHKEYIRLRIAASKKPFVDGPHFELI